VRVPPILPIVGGTGAPSAVAVPSPTCAIPDLSNFFRCFIRSGHEILFPPPLLPPLGGSLLVLPFSRRCLPHMFEWPKMTWAQPPDHHRWIAASPPLRLGCRSASLLCSECRGFSSARPPVDSLRIMSSSTLWCRKFFVRLRHPYPRGPFFYCSGVLSF